MDWQVRELTREDLGHLLVPRQDGSATPRQLRDNHHRVARALAAGLSNIEAGAACGLTPARISQLKADQAMQELIAHYRGLITKEWAQEDTVIEMLRSNAAKAQAQLSDRLDSAESGEAEPLAVRELLGIAELGLDRTGYGKVNRNINVNVDFAAKLEEARQRMEGLASGRTTGRTVIEGVAGGEGEAP